MDRTLQQSEHFTSLHAILHSLVFFRFHTATEQRWKNNLWFHDAGWWIKLNLNEVEFKSPTKQFRIQISGEILICLLIVSLVFNKKINNKKHGNRVKSEFTSVEHPPTKSPLSPPQKNALLIDGPLPPSDSPTAAATFFRSSSICFRITGSFGECHVVIKRA